MRSSDGSYFGDEAAEMGEFEKKPENRNLQVKEIRNNKKDFLSLLLLADEQEDMFDRYIDRGTMFILEADKEVMGECVVTDEDGGVLEIQNLAIVQAFQKNGYGKMLIEYVAGLYHGHYTVLQAETGDSLLTVPFYEKCGFIRHHTIRNYFIEHYDHPIFEAGKQLIDKIYLRREI